MPAVSDTPSTLSPPAPSRTARVAVVRTRPDTVVEDYGCAMDLAGYRDVLPQDRDAIIQTRRSLVIWGDQMIRNGFLRPLEHLLLHSPLMVWAPAASNVYHDAFWYPTIVRSRIRSFMRTEWGQLFRKY